MKKNREVKVQLEIKKLLSRYESYQGSLVPILQEIQKKYGYLTEKAICSLSRLSGISENEIYGLATFYTQFNFTPPGKHKIRVCEGTACHVRGGREILAAFERELNIAVGKKTLDNKFELQRVACVGCCALAPVVVVDEEVHPKNTLRGVKKIIEKYRGKRND